MNKSELIRALAEKEGISLDEAAHVVNTFFETIKDRLKQGKRVEIRGFGSFKIKEYPGYEGRNPSTGETVQVKPKRLPFFRVGKDLREYLNEK
jgi:integration host factor subunit beta